MKNVKTKKPKRLWHNCKAFQDPRIKQMVEQYGHAYYALYWMILEILFSRDGTKLLIDGDKRIVGAQRHLSTEAVTAFVVSCIEEYGLFNSDGIVFWSDLPDGNIYVYSEEYPEE